AKQLVSAGGVAIDMPAGPTEVAIICDTDTDPAFVAADTLSQAEHGPDSDVLVVVIVEAENATHSPRYTDRLQTAVGEQLGELPRADIARQALAHARIVVVADAESALEISDAYAPEHLIIQARRAEWLAEQVQHAGSVFIGPWTPESLGDYASGTNHTLPTAGAARAYAGVSLDSFVRKITFQTATPDGLAALGPHVATMARAEKLDGHAAAVERRLAALENAGAARTGFVRRTTNETDIVVHVDLDGSGRGDCRTGLGFFDHMLDQIARHSGIDLSVICDGDLEVDEHHTIEDTALAIGEALRRAVGDKKGIERYGFTAPMDEAQARVALDLSGRAWLEWDVEFDREHIGDVPTEMFRHFFHSLSDAAAYTLHVSADGENEHHVIEAVFKGFARALGHATSIGSDADRLPSTKGSL
ncbi:MAG: imidazoleglycerol-phosphate dehydratase HisB, partial [Rhodothermales bacterium]|nr:imidazoleglycerol-phosphate dehydratase HisB [Rhodothermales bacterium]